MTHDERIRAVVDCGFTERQARFVVLVMRHAGVCIPRQYASFAGIANGGRRCNAFFDKLVKRGYAREIRCVHNRARVYHIHHKPLYFLIGEASSRYRRLSVAPTWTIRIVFPRPLDHAHDAHQAVIHEELESPLHPVTISELQSYFELRLEAAREAPMHPLNQGFLRKGHEVFAAARFTAMYHRWLKHRDAVFSGPSSHAIAEALNSGRGRVESVVLPNLYRHLAPLVADTRRDPSQ
jgi:hypothetical protein